MFDKIFKKNKNISYNTNSNFTINNYNNNRYEREKKVLAWINCQKIANFYIETYLKEFEYKKYVISNRSVVLLIEDTFVISFSIYYMSYNSYMTVIEELMPNDLFKFVYSKFFSLLSNNGRMNNYETFHLYKKFYGDYEDFSSSPYFESEYLKSMYSEINEKLPEINLKERYENWEGWTYYFIVYEVNYKDRIGCTIHYTQNNMPLNYAYSNVKNLEGRGLPTPETDSLFINNIYYMGTYAHSMNYIKIHKEMYEDYCNDKLELETNSYGYTSLLNKYLYYYVIEKKVKNIHNKDIMTIEKNLITKVESGEFANAEKQLFTIGKYKWKSEELMVKCIKEVFKNEEVIQQYKPFFLYVNKGQLSYDAYIPKRKIAFEYQGKQHFEPIEYFGGKESFEKQQKRDEIKKYLSKKNKIKLIYVNYWEDITPKLILKKLEEENINTML